MKCSDWILLINLFCMNMSSSQWCRSEGRGWPGCTAVQKCRHTWRPNAPEMVYDMHDISTTTMLPLQRLQLMYWGWICWCFVYYIIFCYEQSMITKVLRINTYWIDLPLQEPLAYRQLVLQVPWSLASDLGGVFSLLPQFTGVITVT